MARTTIDQLEAAIRGDGAVWRGNEVLVGKLTKTALAEFEAAKQRGYLIWNQPELINAWGLHCDLLDLPCLIAQRLYRRQRWRIAMDCIGLSGRDIIQQNEAEFIATCQQAGAAPPRRNRGFPMVGGTNVWECETEAEMHRIAKTMLKFIHDVENETSPVEKGIPSADTTIQHTRR